MKPGLGPVGAAYALNARRIRRLKAQRPTFQAINRSIQ